MLMTLASFLTNWKKSLQPNNILWIKSFSQISSTFS